MVSNAVIPAALDGIRAEKQIAQGAAQQTGDPPALDVVRPVMEQMAPLAEAPQVADPVVCRVVIEVGSRENNAALPYPRRVLPPW